MSVSLLLPHLCRPGRDRCDLVESTRRQGPGGGRWQAGWGDPAPPAPRSCTPTWWSTATTTCWTPRLLTWCPRSWPARPWSSLMRPTTSVSRQRGRRRGGPSAAAASACLSPALSLAPRQRLHRLHERQPHPPHPGSVPGQPGDPAEDGAQVGVPRPIDPGAWPAPLVAQLFPHPDSPQNQGDGRAATARGVPPPGGGAAGGQRCPGDRCPPGQPRAA